MCFYVINNWSSISDWFWSWVPKFPEHEDDDEFFLDISWLDSHEVLPVLYYQQEQRRKRRKKEKEEAEKYCKEFVIEMDTIGGETVEFDAEEEEEKKGEDSPKHFRPMQEIFRKNSELVSRKVVADKSKDDLWYRHESDKSGSSEDGSGDQDDEFVLLSTPKKGCFE